MWWSAAPSPMKKAGRDQRLKRDASGSTVSAHLQHKVFCNMLHRQTFPHTAILPCTCSVPPLFWSYRCEACPLFHSLHHQHDKSHSAGRHHPGWPEEVTCPAGAHRTTLTNRGHIQRTKVSQIAFALHGRNSPRLQPARRRNGRLPIGREIRPWLSPSQTFLCPYFAEAMSLNHWPRFPPHLMTNPQS